MKASLVQVEKDVRFYLGLVLKDGLTREEFMKIVRNRYQESDFEFKDDLIKRFSLRDHYGFVDMAEPAASLLPGKLADAALDNGKKLFVCKTITISTTRSLPVDEVEAEVDPADDDSLQPDDDLQE